jgi:hypothetical protein
VPGAAGGGPDPEEATVTVTSTMMALGTEAPDVRSRPGSGVPVTGADLGAAVDALLAGTPVPADERPSMGCSITGREAGRRG